VPPELPLVGLPVELPALVVTDDPLDELPAELLALPEVVVAALVETPTELELGLELVELLAVEPVLPLVLERPVVPDPPAALVAAVPTSMLDDPQPTNSQTKPNTARFCMRSP
jgi:hypothetical protein